MPARKSAGGLRPASLGWPSWISRSIWGESGEEVWAALFLRASLFARFRNLTSAFLCVVRPFFLTAGLRRFPSSLRPFSSVFGISLSSLFPRDVCSDLLMRGEGGSQALWSVFFTLARSAVDAERLVCAVDLCRLLLSFALAAHVSGEQRVPFSPVRSLSKDRETLVTHNGFLEQKSVLRPPPRFRRKRADKREADGISGTRRRRPACREAGW